MKTLSNLINYAFREKDFSLRLYHFEDVYNPEKFIEYYFNSHVSPTVLIRDSDCSVLFKTITMEAYEENGDYERRIPLDPFSSDFFEKLLQQMFKHKHLRDIVEKDIEEARR